MHENLILNGKKRLVIEQVYPEVNCGRFPVKRCVNDLMVVEATLFAEGHDELGAELKFREANTPHWQAVPFQALGNDRWRAEFKINHMGVVYYTITAWIDHFHSWRRDLERWLPTTQDISVELLMGVNLIRSASLRAAGHDAQRLSQLANILADQHDKQAAIELAFSQELLSLMTSYPDLETAVTYDKELMIVVDRVKARFSSWYELFPRSLGANGQHGNLQDLIGHLPYIAAMGFDVVYLPPIHPIGLTFRKGKNNLLQAEPDEPGSPWAIGSPEGGHQAIHPQLGNLQDFQQLIREAANYNLEIALDFALQCTPDHPYVSQHPEWFKSRPDGTIQYAENPPKKYQDIYPLNFQSENWCDLWNECKNILLFWLEQGVKIFRVDNPHTKPFIFWEWLIAEIKQMYPEVIFLSEAFTRQNIMYYLAKLGFTQSYSYFSWRNTKREIMDYFTELTHSPVREYFRPNLWPNTPDILSEYLQTGQRGAFITRLVLAATLGANYGIYGPAFELCIAEPRELGGEEYLNSEKYELKPWDLNHPNSLKDIIALVNKIRQENPSLQQDWNLKFYPIDNEQLICYSKFLGANVIIVIVNLDVHYLQTGWVELPLEELGVAAEKAYWVEDLLGRQRYLWHGSRNYVELDPNKLPAHIFRLSPHVHREKDFEGYE